MTAMKRLHDVSKRWAIVVLAVSLVVLVGSRPGPERVRLTAEFNRAGLNIRAGDEVRLRGVPIGAIERIDTDREHFTARYVLAVDASAPVAADTGARIVPKTLFGDKYVELDPAEPGAPTVHDGAVIGPDRTAHITELEGVIDELTNAFTVANAPAFGAAMSAMAAGLGDGADLRELSEGFRAGGEEVAARREEIHRLLRAAPGLADAFRASTDDLVSAATDFGSVMQLLADGDDELRQMLASNAELLQRAGQLVADPRFGRITSDGLILTEIVRQHPGAIQEYLTGVPIYLQGLKDAVWYDNLLARVPNVLLGLPYVDAVGDLGDDNGGAGFGPDVQIISPEYQDPHLEIPPPEEGGE